MPAAFLCEERPRVVYQSGCRPPPRHTTIAARHFFHMAFPHRFAPFYLNTSFDCMLFFGAMFCIKLEFYFIFIFLRTVVVIPLYLNHFSPLFGWFFLSAFLSSMDVFFWGRPVCLSCPPILCSSHAHGRDEGRLHPIHQCSELREDVLRTPPQTGFLYLQVTLSPTPRTPLASPGTTPRTKEDVIMSE